MVSQSREKLGGVLSQFGIGDGERLQILEEESQGWRLAGWVGNGLTLSRMRSFMACIVRCMFLERETWQGSLRTAMCIYLFLILLKFLPRWSDFSFRFFFNSANKLGISLSKSKRDDSSVIGKTILSANRSNTQAQGEWATSRWESISPYRNRSDRVQLNWVSRQSERHIHEWMLPADFQLSATPAASNEHWNEVHRIIL